MPEPQANGRNLRYSPIKGENDDAVKLRVPAKHQCCTQVQSCTPLPLSPLQIKGLQQQCDKGPATTRKKEFRAQGITAMDIHWRACCFSQGQKSQGNCYRSFCYIPRHIPYILQILIFFFISETFVDIILLLICMNIRKKNSYIW